MISTEPRSSKSLGHLAFHHPMKSSWMPTDVATPQIPNDLDCFFLPPTWWKKGNEAPLSSVGCWTELFTSSQMKTSQSFVASTLWMGTSQPCYQAAALTVPILAVPIWHGVGLCSNLWVGWRFAGFSFGAQPWECPAPLPDPPWPKCLRRSGV